MRLYIDISSKCNIQCIDISSKCNIQCTGHSKNQYPMYRKPPKAMPQCTTTFSIFVSTRTVWTERVHLPAPKPQRVHHVRFFYSVFFFTNSESTSYKFKDRLHLNACKPHAGYRHLSSYFAEGGSRSFRHLTFGSRASSKKWRKLKKVAEARSSRKKN